MYTHVYIKKKRYLHASDYPIYIILNKVYLIYRHETE